MDNIFNKKGLFGIVSLIFFIIVGFFVFWFFVLNPISLENQSENKCVKVLTTCCACNMGGEEVCVLENETGMYEEKLEDCPPENELFCAAVDNCKIKKCEFNSGQCVAIE